MSIETFFFDVEELIKQNNKEVSNKKWDEFLTAFPSYCNQQKKNIEIAHKGAALILNTINVEDMKIKVDHLKSKGGTVSYSPQIDMKSLSVNVTAIFDDALIFESKYDIEILTDLISKCGLQVNTGYETDGSIALSCTFWDIGRYIMGGETNGKH